MSSFHDEAELKTTTISYRCKPSHKHRLETAVNLGLVQNIRNLSELVEYLNNEGLERLESTRRDRG